MVANQLVFTECVLFAKARVGAVQITEIVYAAVVTSSTTRIRQL